MVLDRLAAEGFDSEVVVTRDFEGGYSVDVLVPAPGLLCWVVDWLDGVRVLDPDAEDVTVAQALDYLSLRCHGHTPKEASEAIRRPLL